MTKFRAKTTSRVGRESQEHLGDQSTLKGRKRAQLGRGDIQKPTLVECIPIFGCHDKVMQTKSGNGSISS